MLYFLIFHLGLHLPGFHWALQMTVTCFSPPFYWGISGHWWNALQMWVGFFFPNLLLSRSKLGLRYIRVVLGSNIDTHIRRGPMWAKIWGYIGGRVGYKCTWYWHWLIWNVIHGRAQCGLRLCHAMKILCRRYWQVKWGANVFFLCPTLIWHARIGMGLDLPAQK